MRIVLFASSKLKRFRELRKFKKEHRNVKILKKGFPVKHWGQLCYWVEVEYDD